MKAGALCGVLCLFIGIRAPAQEAAEYLGLRLGWGGGLCYSQGPVEGWGWEGVLGPRWGGLTATGLLVRHKRLGGGSFKTAFGAGPQIGLYRRDNHIGGGEGKARVYLNPGLAFAAGLYASIGDTPWLAGVGYMPVIVFTADRGLLAENIQLTVRYRLR